MNDNAKPHYLGYVRDPAHGLRSIALPAGAQADVYAEVRDVTDEVPWATAGQVRVTWLHRGETGNPVGDLLAHTLQEAEPTGHRSRVWLACEASVMRRLRNQLLEEWRVNPDDIVTRGYGKLGEPNYPDHDYGQD